MKEKKETVNVNAGIPTELIDWMDSEAKEHESSRSGVIRVALKKLKEQQAKEEGGRK